MTKLKFASVAIAVAFALSSTMAYAHGNKRYQPHGYNSMVTSQVSGPSGGGGSAGDGAGGP
jgi:hypothetical protein